MDSIFTFDSFCEQTFDDNNNNYFFNEYQENLNSDHFDSQIQEPTDVYSFQQKPKSVSVPTILNVSDLLERENLADITLPGFIIKLIRENGYTLCYDFIEQEVGKCYSALRRADGMPYTGDMVKNIRGSLNQFTVFDEVEADIWAVNEIEAQRFEEIITKKLKISLQQRISAADQQQTNTYTCKTNQKQQQRVDYIFEQTEEQLASTNYIHPISSPTTTADHLSKAESIADTTTQSKPSAEKLISSIYTMPTSPSQSVNSKRSSEQNIDKYDVVQKGASQQRRRYKRQDQKYETAYQLLNKCSKELKKNENMKFVTKNPFRGVSGNENLFQMWQKLGGDRFVGMMQCFEYFGPIIEEYLELRGKN